MKYIEFSFIITSEYTFKGGHRTSNGFVTNEYHNTYTDGPFIDDLSPFKSFFYQDITELERIIRQKYYYNSECIDEDCGPGYFGNSQLNDYSYSDLDLCETLNHTFSSKYDIQFINCYSKGKSKHNLLNYINFRKTEYKDIDFKNQCQYLKKQESLRKEIEERQKEYKKLSSTEGRMNFLQTNFAAMYSDWFYSRKLDFNMKICEIDLYPLDVAIKAKDYKLIDFLIANKAKKVSIAIPPKIAIRIGDFRLFDTPTDDYSIKKTELYDILIEFEEKDIVSFFENRETPIIIAGQVLERKSINCAKTFLCRKEPFAIGKQENEHFKFMEKLLEKKKYLGFESFRIWVERNPLTGFLPCNIIEAALKYCAEPIIKSFALKDIIFIVTDRFEWTRTLEGRKILIPAVGGNILDYTWSYKQYMTEEHLGSKLFHYIDDEVRNNAQYYLQF